MAYDSPEDSKERDLLGRWPLAVNVFDLIRSAPSTWSLRIGIYARWGEGKTTVLKFIDKLATSNGFKTVWFNPWAAQDKEQLWNTFSDALDESLVQPGSVKRKRKASKLLKSGEELVGPVLGVSNYTKFLPGVATKLAKHLALKRSDVEPLLKELGDNKLVVFIDDLDRSKPELVPYLLLSLRELLDLPQCAFVLALDPHVIAKSLPATHPGWGSTPEFMEKIIDFPFWLPPFQKNHGLALVNSQLSIGGHSIPSSVIADISDLLPHNPRQLKMFFRKLWRLKTVLDRHEEEEINWKLLLLIDLARNVSFTATEKLVADPEFIKDLLRSSFDRRSLEGEEAEGEEAESPAKDKWLSILEETIKELKDDEIVDLKALTKVFNVLAEQLTLMNPTNLQYWAKVGSDPPSLTWKEFKDFMEAWQEQPTGERIRILVEQHAAKIEHNAPKIIREIFLTVVDYREQKLQSAADSSTEAELIIEMRSAEQALSCIEKLISELHVFSAGELGLGIDEYATFFSQCKKWAHFLNHPLYEEARQRELKLLEQAAIDGSKFASSMLEKLPVWLEPLPFDKAQKNLISEVTKPFLPVIYTDLLDRFSRKDGISALWGKDSYRVEKTILFDKKYGFYSQGNIATLRSITQRATEIEHVQVNFLEYLHLLAYGLQKILNPLSREDLQSLVKDKEIIDMAWGAATTRRLQPRMLKSFEETREALQNAGGFVLPVPIWASDTIS